MTVVDMSKLDRIALRRGGHSTPDEGLCLMEAVAYVCGIDHTDRPACVAPLLGEMGRSLNDVLPDGLRQQLIAVIPDLPGTVGDGHDEERSYMALDWLIRTWLPAWLDQVPACREDAARVRELGRIVDLASGERAGPVVRRARVTATAARDAAGAVAGDAAGAVAGAVVRDAAGNVAGNAAGNAAGAAAGDAAWVAAWVAAHAAAGNAGAALRPTVEQLQRSAIELYGRMARVGHEGVRG